MIEEEIPKITLNADGVPDRTTATSDEAYAIDVFNWLGYIDVGFTPDSNAMADALNVFADEANILKLAMNSVASDTTDIKNQAVSETTAIKDEANAASQIALTSANFKGEWISLNGALATPASVYYNGLYYMLLENVADVSAWNPSTTSKWAQITTVQEVKTPIAISPLSGATEVDLQPTLVASAYRSIYSSNTRNYRRFELDLLSGDFSTPAFEFEGNVDEIALNVTLDQSEQYKWRCMDISNDAINSSWSGVQNFTTGAISIAIPIVSVTGEPDEVGETPTITTSSFAVNGGTDTHLNTDWQILDDQLDVVWESLANSTDKLSIALPSGYLEVSKEYVFRARHRGTTYGVSNYGTKTATTKSEFTVPMSPAGSQGYGVAPCPGDISLLGLTELAGTNDITTAMTTGHYGNYMQIATGAIMFWRPKFFYRVGHPDSPNYAEYGENAIDTVGTDVFSTEAEANLAGYKMPRAFKDGGFEKDGYFEDKYINSQMNTDSNKCTSVAGEIPISLTPSATYTNSSGMTGCTGIVADAVTLAKARGAGYACNTSFAWSVHAIISIAHAQASTSDTYCAWYDATGTTNFPKGCNDNALGDTNDATVAYAGSGESNKPKCGATSNFNKTTDNGQACGCADLNGSLYEMVIGITNYGTSATSSTAIATNNIYILKDTVAVKDLTGGWDGTNDVWGNTTHLDTLYDTFTSPATIATAVLERFGNGANGVFADDERVVGFIPKNDSATSSTGTNQFGTDLYYKYNIQNITTKCGGVWGDAANAGVFYRNFSNSRTSDFPNNGFRSIAYLPN